MTEGTQDPNGVADTIQPATLETLFTETVALKNRAEAAASAAEEANRRANSESGFAFNAKQNAEDHAKAISQIRGTVEADTNWLATTKQDATADAEAISTARKVAEGDARATADTKSASEAEMVAIRAIKDKVEAARSVAEKSSEESVSLAKRMSDDTAAVTQARANVETSASNVQALQAQVAEAATKVQADAVAVSTRANDSKQLIASLTNVTETATAAQERVVEYEHKLDGLVAQIMELHGKIEALLPGATSVGLASAFRDQQARCATRQRARLASFIVTIVGLLIVGAYGLPGMGTEPVTWDSILRHFASRLPLIAPLVWLALVAARNYNLAIKLQEDYAYKEAISRSFEGYRREMGGIPAGSDQAVPILTLSDNVLRTLGERPGRLYDGVHEDLTPLSPLIKLLKETRVVDALRAMARDKTPDKPIQ